MTDSDQNPELDSALRELEEGARTQELQSGVAVPKIQLAMMRAMLRLASTPTGRALRSFFAPENRKQRESIFTPEGRNEYRDRLARTLETGDIEVNRRIVTECSWYARLTPKQQAAMLRQPMQQKLAASILAEIEPVPKTSPPRPRRRSGETLSSVERIRLARSLKLAGSEVDFDRLYEARIAEDWDTFFELILSLQFSAVLALIPPPPGEAFGKRNRSPMLLSSERKKCDWHGCPKPVPNPSHFCAIHRIQGKKDKREQKLERRRRDSETAALAAANRRAVASLESISPAADGSYPNTLAPIEDLRTQRRRLQNR